MVYLYKLDIFVQLYVLESFDFNNFLNSMHPKMNFSLETKHLFGSLPLFNLCIHYYTNEIILLYCYNTQITTIIIK